MKKYLFLDLETTGLDPNGCVILEVAVAVTDEKFNILDTYEGPVRASEGDLNKMDEWCTNTHTKSGLLALVKEHGVRVSLIEQDLIEFTKEHFNGQKIILAGNSIHFDRSFLKVHMPEFEKRLHYRMIDVSSFGIVVEDYFGMRLKKTNAHRAMPDVLESIDEIKDYVEYFRGVK